MTIYMLANQPLNFQKGIVQVARVKPEMGTWEREWQIPTSHTEEPTHYFKTVNKKNLLFQSSYGENTSIIYLKDKNFESIGSLTAENISYKQLEVNYFYMDAALLKDTVLASHGEKCNSTVYHLKAFFHGEKKSWVSAASYKNI